MDDARRTISLPDDPHQLKTLLIEREEELAQRDERLAQLQASLATVTRQRDEFYLKNLQLEVRLAKALKQAYGPRADRVSDAAQMLMDFGQKLESSPVHAGDLPPEANGDSDQDQSGPATQSRRVSRRLRSKGRRDIGSLNNLPIVEQMYELTGELCRCLHCQAERKPIGEQISWTIEHVPAQLLRVKHIQYKYACRPGRGLTRTSFRSRFPAAPSPARP
jgi:hypothetical protein